MPDEIMQVSSTTPFSGYLRILSNCIIESMALSRSDIEEKTRIYEANKIPGSTEKQLSARTRAYLMNFFGRHMLDWPTAVKFFRILGATRIKLSVTLYYGDDDTEGNTFSVETGADNPALLTDTLPLMENSNDQTTNP